MQSAAVQRFGNPKAKVLIVDDDVEVCQLIDEILHQQFSTLRTNDPRESIRLAIDFQPDVILLDLMMPEMDGIEVCKQLRQNNITSEIPVIMLTAANQTPNRVKAFNIGADDFIAKPFDHDELIARINAKLRRLRDDETSCDDTKPFDLGNLHCDPQRYEVRVVGKEIKLSAFEFQLLHLLLRNKDRLVTRKEIMEKVWNDPATPDRLIDAHMVSLRKRLHDFDHVIQTVYGSGYRLRSKD